MIVSLVLILLYFKEQSITYKAARFEILCQVGSYFFLLMTIAIFDFCNREKLKTSFYKDLSSCRYQTMNAIFFINFLMEVYIFYHPQTLQWHILRMLTAISKRCSFGSFTAVACLSSFTSYTLETLLRWVFK